MSKNSVSHIYTAIYSPQSNAAERINRSIIAGIRSYSDSDQRHWDQNLSKIAVALRNAKHQAHGFSLYFVLFAQQMITHGSSYEILRKLSLLQEGEDEVEKADRLQILRETVKENKEKHMK